MLKHHFILAAWLPHVTILNLLSPSNFNRPQGSLGIPTDSQKPGKRPPGGMPPVNMPRMPRTSSFPQKMTQFMGWAGKTSRIFMDFREISPSIHRTSECWESRPRTKKNRLGSLNNDICSVLNFGSGLTVIWVRATRSLGTLDERPSNYWLYQGDPKKTFRFVQDLASPGPVYGIGNAL